MKTSAEESSTGFVEEELSRVLHDAIEKGFREAENHASTLAAKFVKRWRSEVVLSRLSDLPDLFWQESLSLCITVSDTGTESESASARARLRDAVDGLRTAKSLRERRLAAREFLDAVAELIICLLAFLSRALLLLLSRLLNRAGTKDDLPTWMPDPIETAPQITPRGPNPAFPVSTYRGGRRSSTPGGVAVAA
ncbi:hypothetical protein OG900_10265 [Streptomyces sp. NBC_00433]